ncbi:type I polyketide synthase [Corallococcus llansteffanensis]|uniref:Acyltransferase domain-containing protein n=1 Tax=Corallococcus llansteffanensis TaxID=2316731 RepID=A0A3A8PUH5_9BACT|nr:type I polyketide synthase [Corallococcus llansteffanensis]RKH58571.1 acyltransferase domain-containing protein [Corallococcus llansteffanensis]
MSDNTSGTDIAIVGLAGRFPGARDVNEFWRNLCDGVESFQSLTDAEALAAGASPAALEDPAFVKVVSKLDDVAGFDAAYFGYSPREAELMDPQQRLFLECALEALEDAGHGAPPGELLVGVFGGQALSTYLVFHLLTNAEVLRTADPLQLNLGNAGSFLTTRASYKLDLRGPSFNVESACSTSLVAVHVACQSLLNHECDLALAGGVSINLGLQGGYRFVEGGILSPDGRCRPFDKDARGIVFGSGAGVVALRRLEDALQDNDPIYAVIKGSAVNNDGALRAGYTAPGVDGQASVISEALGNAGVSAGSLGYVEAHGTGTALGDPIEVQALTRAFGDEAAGPRTCVLGSVKANIGHLDAAAGVTGLIKTALALKHRKLPPSIHASNPHPLIPWESTPFYLNDDLREWKAPARTPRRAGVSSFGMGGTNAHVILEEAPAPRPTSASAPAPRLLVLSARTPGALAAQTARLAEHLRSHPQADLADVAWTLQVGRRRHAHRRAVVAHDVAEAVQALSSGDRLPTAAEERTGRPVVFLLSGQGSQYVDMARGLYEHERVFREQVDGCASLLRPHLGLDLRDVLYPRPEKRDEARLQLEQTRLAQPALFTVEYALAKLWESWGLKPEALLGHSLGEYVAACLAGVFTLADALSLVAARGALMQSLPSGAMLSVALPEADLLPHLGTELSLAAVNAPAWTVVSGPEAAVEALRTRLEAQGARCRRLHTSHAFHSAMMEPILERFTEAVRKVRLQAPRLPYVSNVTGTWVTAAEATDPRYWARHLRQPVRFAEGLSTLGQKPNRVFLEVGPGRALTTFAGQGPGRERALVTSVRHPEDSQPDTRFLMGAVGKLWLAGVDVDWAAVNGAQSRRRVSLPTYPFERRRHWVPAGTRVASGVAEPVASSEVQATASAPSRPGLRTAYVAPGTEEEKLVASLWEEVLGVRPVGVHDDFFDLGGHSLLATTVVGRLRETLGFSVPLQSLFESPTVGRMAELIASLREHPSHADAQTAALLRMLADLCPEAPVAAR